MRPWGVLLAAAFLAPVAPVVRAADICSTCELQLGIGATYHFWQTTHSLVVPVIFNFDHDRWELGAFRFTGNQEFFDSTFQGHVRFATPYWGFSFTRRLELFKHPTWRIIVGLGGSYKTQEDTLSASHWNFSEQLGLRLTPTPAYAVEVVGRHWSNAGLKLPNHGQDFFTLTFTVYPSLWRHARTSN
jgi:Lipid A 3-O-deacylase (PagL)